MPHAFPKKAGGPTVTFESDRVHATGAIPGATIYFAAVSLYDADGTLYVGKIGGTAIADASGNADFSADVQRRSVWLIVDAAKGYTVAAPFGMFLREMDFPGEAPEAGNGDIRHLVLRRFHVEAFLIRPQGGIWTAYFRDGGPHDDDGQPNGSNNVSLGDLAPVGTMTGEAGHLTAGDYLFLVDRNSLEFHVSRRGAQ